MLTVLFWVFAQWALPLHSFLRGGSNTPMLQVEKLRVWWPISQSLQHSGHLAAVLGRVGTAWVLWNLPNTCPVCLAPEVSLQATDWQKPRGDRSLPLANGWGVK